MDKPTFKLLQGHLLIGPPASGKTTVAKIMAEIFQAEIISTDAIRKDIYGDEKVQGIWSEIYIQLKNKILDCIKLKKDFIIDATNVKRAWRLNLTQNLTYTKELEWIGWWLNTPKDKCIDWNKNRERIIQDNLINDYWEILNDKNFGPSISEGFTDLRIIDPYSEKIDASFFKSEIKKMKLSIIERRKNYPDKDQLHDYSALIDLERLIFLINFLSNNPYPEFNEDYILENARQYLIKKHGSCYGDHEKIKQDFLWLTKNQFFFDGENKNIYVSNKNKKNFNSGGWPYTARRDRFIQTFSLLRHILHNPFDYSSSDGNIYESLVLKLSSTHTIRESRKIKEDCEKIIRPYFFRNKNTKHRNGYCIGTAILTKSQLKDLWVYIDQASRKLGDTNAQALNTIISSQLKQGAILPEDLNPIRVFANHSIISQSYTNKCSLAKVKNSKDKLNIEQIKLGIKELEDSILKGNRIIIERLKSAADYPNSKTGKFYPVWPLQLIFNNIAWYLAYEDAEKTLKGNGLIQVERLDRISLNSVEPNNIRSKEEKNLSLLILNKLMSISGGIYFGDDAKLQRDLYMAENNNDIQKYFVKVKILTNERIYKFLREGLSRYPLNQIRMSKPLSGDIWKVTNPKVFTLKPNPKSTHPFPIEIFLPSWTVDGDVDFHKWLFGFSDGIKIESPVSLRSRHIKFAQAITNLYK